MKVLKTVSPVILAIAVCFAMLPFSIQADAAAKKKVCVVSKITYKYKSDGKNVKLTTNPKYDKGFLKQYKDWDTVYKFAYGKNHKLKTMTSDYAGVSETEKYTWKKGKIHKRVSRYEGDTDLDMFFYKYKGKKVKKVIEKEKTKGDHSDGDGTTVGIHTFKYNKKGNLSEWKCDSDTLPFILKYTYDKKGNLKKVFFPKSGGKKAVVASVKAKYKNGRISKVTVKDNILTPHLITATFKYKKVKVKKADAKRIKAQQWKMINWQGENFAW